MKKLTAALALAPAAAWAHTGGDHLHSFFDGIAHPFWGLDHLLALVAVGLCAARLIRGRSSLLQAIAVLALALGILVAAGLPVINLEPAIVATLVVLGGWVGLMRSIPLGVSASVMAVALFCHGLVHGQEVPLGAGLGYGFGLVAGSALAVLVAAFVGRELNGRMGDLSSCIVGAMVAVSGIVFAV